MKWDVFNISGQKVKSIELPDDIYNVEMNDAVLHSVVKGYRANRRQGTHATKTKSMVSGGGKKPFKQKGTGNARQGSSRSSIMPGGGKSHGPQPRDYTERTPLKLKRLALKIALSDKVRFKQLIVVDDFAIHKYSTKQVLTAVKGLCKETTKNQQKAKALLADERKDDFLHRSARNIPYISAVSSFEMNAEDVLRYPSLIVSESAVKALMQRLGGEN